MTLVPITLAALILRVRTTLVVSLVCLALALYVIDLQDRWDGPTFTVICFSVLGGVMRIVLSYLFKQVEELYETERSTTAMLESLAAQLQTLQEVAVLHSARPLPDLLTRVIDQAGQLLGSDGCTVYRYDRRREVLDIAVTGGTPWPGAAGPAVPVVPPEGSGDPVVQAAAATERSRLARDLHDSVTQSLFAASLKAEAIRRRRPRPRARRASPSTSRSGVSGSCRGT